MVDITNKINEIEKMVDNEFYFTMNRPRQYGKTTTLSLLKRLLKEKYLVISISFEGIGDSIFQCEENFSKTFIEMLSENIELSYEVESKLLFDLSKYNSPWNIAIDFNVEMSFSIDGEQFIFNPLDPVINIGLTYGILKKGENGVEISNKIFEEIIYNYMLSKIKTSTKNMSLYNFKENFIKENKEFKEEKIDVKDKNIFGVYV